MPSTYTLIAKNTLANAASSVSFSSIPQNYTHLIFTASTRTTDAALFGYYFLRFNSDAGANYTFRGLQGSGSANGVGSTGTQSGISVITCGDTATANTFGSAELYIPNYTGTTNKAASSTTVTENNAQTAYAMVNAYLWSNTSAITSITILPVNAVNFKSGSSFFLYGINRA